MSNPVDRFNELAEEYDEFTDAMPNYREMNEMVLELFERWFEDHPPESICELGCGTGTMTRTVVDEFEPDHYVALDGAEKMVERAVDTFSDYTGPTHVRFEKQVFEEWSPETTFDVVYSSLSIHHMSDPDKRALYRTVREALNTDGLFLYADLFDPPEALDNYYYEVTRQRRLDGGMTEEEFEERWQSHLDNDCPSSWFDSLDWLTEAGFETVDCGWKNANRAVLMAFP
jgi:tRNA (cmo5U34)-methyltransferase